LLRRFHIVQSSQGASRNASWDIRDGVKTL